MEGVEIIMTFLRVLKWISLIVSILAIALCAVGHGFVLADMNVFEKNEETKYLMKDIKSVLADHDDIISGIFSKDEKKADTAEDNSTVSEATPTETAIAADEEIENTSGYTVEGKNEIIIALMKYGTMSCGFNWITDHIETMKGSEINVCVFVFYAALLVAFILHMISKANKSFYGYLLMIVGFLFYSACILGGYYFSETIITLLKAFSDAPGNDWPLYRVAVITVCFVFANLIGLPIYRCGVRQIACKRLKKRIAAYQRKLARKN